MPYAFSISSGIFFFLSLCSPIPQIKAVFVTLGEFFDVCNVISFIVVVVVVVIVIEIPKISSQMRAYVNSPLKMTDPHSGSVNELAVGVITTTYFPCVSCDTRVRYWSGI